VAKRLTKEEKEEIIRRFTLGKSIDQLSNDFKCTKLTISRNLKISLGEMKYKELIDQNKSTHKTISANDKYITLDNKNESDSKTVKKDLEEEYFPFTPFLEITPLNCEIENSTQKDLSSVPISDFEFPQIVYMVVDKKIELETKYLKDYPDWQFLSKEEQSRKTIEIYLDLKNAKRICNKDQKVIKVPNTDVFKIVAPILLSRGISRIVSSDKLIAL